ncbi:MAG TPA: hypothetical protein VFR07_01195 [Mycobacteriales bacterium]|nr:hypothetical protein [Mycobacteriales bacterium]
MTARHESSQGRRPGDALVRLGAAVFVLGVVAVVVGVVPSVLADRPGDATPVVLAAALLPTGLGIALAGLLRAARTGRREAARAGRPDQR